MTRVVFTFNAEALRSLKRMISRGGFRSMGAALGESLRLHDTLQNQARAGFSELLVRDRKRNLEREVMVPSLRRIARRIRC